MSATPSGKASPSGRVDLFLKVTGTKGGVIKGEAEDSGDGKQTHADEIEVNGWAWGMKSATDISTGQASGKRQMRSLRIIKNLDAATCPLMTMLSQNEVIKEAVLTARKAGGDAVEFFKIKIEKARVIQFDVEYLEPVGSGAREVIELAFQKIEIRYTPQGKDGQKRGDLLFLDEWAVQ